LDGINLALLGASLTPTPLLTDFSVVEPSEPLVYGQENLYVDAISSADAGVKHIEDVDAIIDDFGLNAYNFGGVYLGYSQYLTLSRDMLLAAAIIVICCFAVTTIFLMDIHSGIIMGGILVVNAVEIYGFMGHFGIDLSFYPVAVYLGGIALGVEFTAPLVFYFLKATAGADKTSWLSRHNERMHKALEHRFTPIYNGSVTTFVGVGVLFFAPVRFIRLYFFGVYMITIVIGVINGLLFLPVLLSVIGPLPQVSKQLLICRKLNILCEVVCLIYSL